MPIFSEKPIKFDEDEIPLIDVLRFLRSTYKTILVFGVLGFAIAVAYLVITPNRYEAVAQIMMAQIAYSNSNSNSNSNTSPLGVNVEQPALLIVRFASPASYTPQVINACGHENYPNAGLAVSNSIKLSIPNGLNNLVELRAFGSTPQEARACAQAVIELIKTTQAQISAPYIDGAKVKLSDYEQRLKNAKEMLTRGDKPGQAMSVGYQSVRDEIHYLFSEIAALKNQVIINQSLATRLVAPIYVSDAPITPRKRMTLAAGLLGGLFLGFLIALARQILLRVKSALDVGL